MGTALPWSWPRDGRRETLEGAGVALAEQYTAQGLNMLYTHAQFEDGSVSVEAGLMKMLTMMETGKFKVFSPLLDWFEEFRLYHRKDGKVVKEGDDLLAATRYGVMMLRFAEQIYRKRETVHPCPTVATSHGWVRRGCGETAGCCLFKPHGCTAVGNARRAGLAEIGHCKFKLGHCDGTEFAGRSFKKRSGPLRDGTPNSRLRHGPPLLGPFLWGLHLNVPAHRLADPSYSKASPSGNQASAAL